MTVKQVKAILSKHGLPIDSCTPAAEELCELHRVDLDSIKEERDTLKEAVEKAESNIHKVSELQTKLTETESKLKESEKEIADYHKLKDDLSAKETRTAKEKAFTDVLKGLNISDKWHARIIRGEDFGAIELNKDGTIKGADKLTERIKDEWGDTIGTQVEKGYNTPTPPANNGKTTMTKEDIAKITDTAERQKAMLENISLYE